MKILCLYVFHKINKSVTNFIENCIFEDENIDFLFISNNLNITRENINLPKFCDFISRENVGFDFGGWSYGLLHNDRYKKYDKFIFVNCSVIGPFLKDNEKNWTNIFLEKLSGNVKIVGPTINYTNPNFCHVQSYLFCMNKETLEFLIKEQIFTLKYFFKTKEVAINYGEILMSQKVIKKKNWNIGCLINCYKDIDFTKNIRRDIAHGDLMYFKYQNKLWNIYDLVFVKFNRDINYHNIY